MPEIVLHYIWERCLWAGFEQQTTPGRLGVWLGWRIVESYMEHNEEVTLQELIAEGDAQKILENSYYKH